jgi:hypothetical protein
MIRELNSANRNVRSNTHTFDNTPHRLVLPRLPLFLGELRFYFYFIFAYRCASARILGSALLEMVAGAMRKSKSDIVLSTLAVSLYTE